MMVVIRHIIKSPLWKTFHQIQFDFFFRIDTMDESFVVEFGGKSVEKHSNNVQL